eukprot:15471578-Alexandrium_andersonii.AAC.1
MPRVHVGDATTQRILRNKGVLPPGSGSMEVGAGGAGAPACQAILRGLAPRRAALHDELRRATQ